MKKILVIVLALVMGVGCNIIPNEGEGAVDLTRNATSTTLNVALHAEKSSVERSVGDALKQFSKIDGYHGATQFLSLDGTITGYEMWYRSPTDTGTLVVKVKRYSSVVFDFDVIPFGWHSPGNGYVGRMELIDSATHEPVARKTLIVPVESDGWPQLGDVRQLVADLMEWQRPFKIDNVSVFVSKEDARAAAEELKNFLVSKCGFDQLEIQEEMRLPR